MGKGWEKEITVDKKSQKEKDKVLKVVMQKGEEKIIKKSVKISFTANQFIIRLPTQLSDHLGLTEENVNQYMMILVWGSKKEGKFEVIKNDKL